MRHIVETDHDNGFSLVELLVVIVVLGILSIIAVFAIRGITDRSEASVCASDRKVLTHAMEARRAKVGSYTDESTLAAEGLLRSPSSLHDITLSVGDYVIVAVGSCAAIAVTTVLP